MNIFFDLDGTLIDSKERLYHLFQELIPQSNFTIDEYWFLKRNKIDHKTIITRYFKDIDFIQFETNWMKLIEAKEYLDFDTPFKDVECFLKKLKLSNKSLFLVTARQSISGVNYQLNKYGWISLFKNILVTEQKYSKAELIRPHLKKQHEDWIIGDTGSDILIGKELNIKTAAVNSGFLSHESLKEYKPDILLEKVTDFKLFN